jgi:uncharacterized protein (TIGR00369 family)
MPDFLQLALNAAPSTLRRTIIRRRFAKVIPFNTLLGVNVVHLGDGFAEATLASRPELSNHIGSHHAGAIFSLAEAASGAAMAGVFSAVILKTRAVVRTARIDYRKPSRIPIAARAASLSTGEQLRQTLGSAGEVEFEIKVDVGGLDKGSALFADATFVWHVAWSKRRT